MSLKYICHPNVIQNDIPVPKYNQRHVGESPYIVRLQRHVGSDRWFNPIRMNNIIQAAIDYRSADLSVVPVTSKKYPSDSWAQYQRDLMPESDIPAKFRDSWGVGIVCGWVSSTLELIDFDAHGGPIEDIFNKFISDDRVAHIIATHNPYIERTQSGGFHLIYTYDSDKPDGNLKLANWPDGKSMIETRGEGGLVVVAPSPGYTRIEGNITNPAHLSIEERDYMIDLAKSFNQYVPSAPTLTDTTPEDHHHNTDPVSWFNWFKQSYAKELLKENGWDKVETTDDHVEKWRRPGKDDGHSATWGKRPGHLYVFSSSAEPFQNDCYYTPFQILTILRFKGDHRSAQEWIIGKYFTEEIPYIRIGTKYFKRIIKKDRFNIDTIELKIWDKDEIKQDHGKSFLNRIPHYDDFIMTPNNLTYEPVVNSCYNLYHEFRHRPSPGQWKWTEILLRHIFGDQYELGIRLLQIYYLHPDRMTPILVLVSRERQTGKTTFVNWINMVFGDNVANISPDDLVNGFNAPYANSNIITVEETIIEKGHTVEKIKALSTSKFITVNQKFISQYRTPFFGKFILTSNNEDRFVRIDQEEIRFFIRKINTPSVYNHNIEADLVREIPAFLHYLQSTSPVDFSRDRSGFTPEELFNENLKSVKEESRSDLYKELSIIIEDLFLNELADQDSFEADATSFKERFFANNNQIPKRYIRDVLSDQFKLKPNEDSIYFKPFGTGGKTGRPYTFKREDFTKTPSDSTPF